MQEFVHDIYCRYIDENLSGCEVDERRVFFAAAEAFLQNDLQKYERTLHY